MAMISCRYFSYSVKYDWTASARCCAKDTKVFLLTARIVLKDDPALVHKLARLCEKVKVERSIVLEGFFIFKGQRNWWSTITATFLPLTWQFYVNFIATWRYRDKNIYFGGTLQFFNKTTKKSISARRIKLCNISNEIIVLGKTQQIFKTVLLITTL